jgi:hypothetical protein
MSPQVSQEPSSPPQLHEQPEPAAFIIDPISAKLLLNLLATS